MSALPVISSAAASAWTLRPNFPADLDRLKPIDIEFMRKLHTKVNLIPVIAKADTLTDDEVTTFKQRVSGTPSACQLHGIEWLYRKCSYS